MKTMKSLFFRALLLSLLLNQVARAVEKRNPPAFDILKSCHPALMTSIEPSKLSLEIIKEKLDLLAPTLKSFELEKQWILVEPGSKSTKPGQADRRRLTLRTQRDSQFKTKTLSYEKIDPLDTGENLPIPSEHRINPSQQVINSYLFKFEILEVIRTQRDEKSKGRTLEYQKTRDLINDLNYSDSLLKLQFRCHKKPLVGIICFCDKK